MDEESKQLLERNLFTQGLLLKWQEKALPLPVTMFIETLYKASTVKKQDKQLAQMASTKQRGLAKLSPTTKHKFDHNYR